VAGKVKELSNAIWQARSFRPDGVVLGEELWDMVSTEDQSPSVQYPWKGLNDKLLGIRAGELVTLCSGTGIGKSSICRELAYHLVAKGSKIGYIALEESVKRSAQGIMAVHMNCPPFKWTEEKVSVSRMKEAFESTLGTGRVVLYDHWGSCESENLIAQIRYMAKAAGCTHIFLDHLSIIVSAQDNGDERKAIDNLMTKLRTLVQELEITLFCVSHLRRPQGNAGHEDGQSVSLSQLRGSGAIAQLSDAVITLERNSMAENESERHTTKVAVAKNRFNGYTGPACHLRFDTETGRMCEVEEETL
jgi:twinkle protein